MVLKILAGSLLGSGLGALMGYFGKCSSGACPLTANPWRGAFFGLMIGLMFAFSFGRSRAATPAAAPENVKVITGQEDFAKLVEKSTRPVFVKFHAPWCGWCRKLAPIVEKLAGEYRGRMDFVQVNTEDNADLAKRFSVEGLPTSLIFENGRKVEAIVGYRDEAALRKIIEKHVAQDKEQKAGDRKAPRAGAGTEAGLAA